MQHLHLSQQWQCKQRSATQTLEAAFASADDWLPATVPGSIHMDLLAAGRIADPFYGQNEKELQWIGEADWLYRCQFSLPADFARDETTELCFDGLDTFATVWLNGMQILCSDNMFVPYRVRVASLLQPGQNELRILFESAMRRGKELETQYGALAAWNGDASRLYVRKAQYHYGWDWGPTFITAGLWRSVRLETFTARIADVHCPVEVSEDLSSAALPVQVQLASAQATLPSNLMLRLCLFSAAGKRVAEHTLPATEPILQHTFTLAQPELWWPRGYGEQPLYRLETTLVIDGETLDRAEERLGLRRLRLVQQALVDQEGTSFFFEINNTPIFCGGANWIPADSFLSRATPERYRAWLQLAAEGNLTMLRVWGGGIYEEDIFYALCDELGLLVWQDFMFACGMYPAHEQFQASVQAEAEANIRRLRHHPSLVVWSGNNEDYLVAGSLGTYDSAFDGDFTQTAFPGRTLYERLLPTACAQLDPTRPYWPGSPYAGSDANDLTLGDQHVWSVWHGQMASYQQYDTFPGRFVSEFGMQAFPDLKMIEAFTPQSERYPQSSTLDFHNKAGGGPERLGHYLIENVRYPVDLADYVYKSQLVQSEALVSGIRGWRRRWAGPQREYSAGALVWQINDCWPVVSWAYVDFELHPKAAYYTIKRALASFALGLVQGQQDTAELWAVNGTLTALEADVELRTWTLQGECVGEETRHVTLLPNQATELGTVPYTRNKQLVINARLLKDGAALARTALWPEPFKYLDIPDPEIKLAREDDTIIISAVRPAKGVLLSADANVSWDDNMLDILPGDPQTIVAHGLGTAAIDFKRLK
jgi:beta-mannosidase